jgi:hypothetical protein
METLLEALTQYAEENLVVRYLREYAPQIQTAQLREERLTEKLAALAPETAEHVEQLKNELSDVYSCREQAFLLSGISIGLALGRL